MWERLSDFEPKRLNFDNENCDEVYRVFGQTFEFDNDEKSCFYLIKSEFRVFRQFVDKINRANHFIGRNHRKVFKNLNFKTRNLSNSSLICEGKGENRRVADKLETKLQF